MTDSTETERSGPYGRACLNCAKAKTKCNFGSNQRICERYLYHEVAVSP